MMAVIALTDSAVEQAVRIKEALPQAELFLSIRYRERYPAHSYIEEGLAPFVAGLWPRYSQFVFIMAAGIVVRIIAPLLRSKAQDPAVVVLDEKGQYVISLLSGHLGGANDLAREIAGRISAVPVITTATDVEGLPALDDMARRNGCVLENPGDWKKIAMALLEKKETALYSTVRMAAVFPPHVVEVKEPGESKSSCHGLICITERELLPEEKPDLPCVILRPRNIIAGIGCRKGKTKQEIKEALNQTLANHGISPHSLSCLATMELKKNEPGLVEAAAELGIPLVAVTAAEISTVENKFNSSGFVKSRTGVGSVAEPAAWLTAGEPLAVSGKTRCSGITVALVKDMGVTIF